MLAKVWLNFVILVFFSVNGLIHNIAKYDPEFHWINQPFCGLRNKVDYQGFCLGYEYKQTLFNGENFLIDDDMDDMEPTERMLYGEHLAEGQAPWIAFVMKIDMKSGLPQVKSQCIGTLISLDWVITAEHCFNNSGEYNLAVSAGSPQLGKNQNRKLIKWIPHPEFDIALIKVNQPFQQTVKNNIYTLNPICLPVKNVINTDIISANIIGHRRDNYFLMNRGLVLIDLPDTCEEKHYCTVTYLEGEPRLCQGDSGGPLYQYTKYGQLTKAVLIGTLVAGFQVRNGTCDQTYRDKWFTIPHVIDWILNTTRDN